MRIRWTPAAAEDLQAIHDYLREHEPRQARPTIVDITQRIRTLKEFPNMGRPGKEEATRELALSRSPYIVVYRVKDDAVELVHIWHGAQNWH